MFPERSSMPNPMPQLLAFDLNPVEIVVPESSILEAPYLSFKNWLYPSDVDSI